MNDYQLGFTHACRLIRSEMKQKIIPVNVEKIFYFIEQEEIEAIKKGIGY